MSLVSANGGYIGANVEYFARYSRIQSYSFISSSSGVNANSLVVPADAQAGDIAILVDSVNSASANIAAPSTWRAVAQGIAAAGNLGMTTSIKLLTSSDPSATVSSPDTTTTDHFMLCAIFRPSAGSKIFSLHGDFPETSVSTGAPALVTAQLINIPQPSMGFVIFAQRGSNNVTYNINTTPTADGNINCLDEASRSVIRIYYKLIGINDTGVVNMTGRLNDAGVQGNQAFCLYPDSSFDVDTTRYNSGIFRLDATMERT